jgi:pyruvate dehydrogenase E2 component (dihydrolipoamide acetyltransferase)
MAVLVLMPKNSDTMAEGKVIRWLKSEGESVLSGDALVEIETDKVNLELEATAEGVLRKIVVPESATVPVGQVLAVIGTASEDISRLVPNDTTPEVSPVQPAASRVKVGSDPGHPVAPDVFSNRVMASPWARSKAERENIDLHYVAGTGPGGRVIGQDVDRIIADRRSLSAAHPDFGADGLPAESDFLDEPLSSMRQAIASRLARSLGPVPHFYLTVEMDMKHAVELRQSASALVPPLTLSFNDIIIKACATALRSHPAVNTAFMGDRIRTFKRIHIGMVVAIESGGLITPVLRDCDRKNLSTISEEASKLAARARDRKLLPSEYTGATFTVSNLGMRGIEEFSAIINPPEAAILAVGAVAEKPVVSGGRIEIGHRCRMTLSCDHRIVDGATGAAFLRTLQRIVEAEISLH